LPYKQQEGGGVQSSVSGIGEEIFLVYEGKKVMKGRIFHGKKREVGGCRGGREVFIRREKEESC